MMDYYFSDNGMNVKNLMTQPTTRCSSLVEIRK